MTIDEFLDRLLILYGPPESANDEAFVAEYRELLGQSSARLLKPASDYIVSTHTRRGWPTPAEIKIALSKASPIVFGVYKPPEHRPFEEDTMTEEERQRREMSKARVDQLAKNFIETHRWKQ